MQHSLIKRIVYSIAVSVATHFLLLLACIMVWSDPQILHVSQKQISSYNQILMFDLIKDFESSFHGLGYSRVTRYRVINDSIEFDSGYSQPLKPTSPLLGTELRRFGLPFPWASFEVIAIRSGGSSLKHGYKVAWWGGTARGLVLPLRLDGIACLLSFAVVFIVVYGVALCIEMARKFLRLQHGLCRNCGYPNNVGEICSECGDS